MTVIRRLGIPVLAATIASLTGYGSALAQEGARGGLEEIVVTAQRREQSLQEVPISIEAVTGAQIQQQGYRDLNELANFSPSVYIDDSGYLSQDRSIRGFGTYGNALTLEQAVPIFVDGIHFGRPAQVKLAFLDPAQVEVLKGPQPVYFGMNASAGAFNITSRGPTEEWEGYLDTEFGNYSTTVLNAAIGGPISDKLGIRVAGKYENAGGFIEDVVTGQDLGAYENFGARVILEYDVSDSFQVSGKVEYAEINKDNEATSLCLTEGTLIFGRNGPDDDPGELQGDERSIWAGPPKGVGWSQAYEPIPDECFKGKGVSNGGPFFAPPTNIREENSNFGAIDARAAVEEWSRQVGIIDSFKDIGEDVETLNGYLKFDWTLANEIEVSWLNGFSTMDRANTRDNSNTPFLLNMQNRSEDFEQFSSELRFTSGPGDIEWMAGVLWQDTQLDFISNSPRPNVRRGLRYNEGWEKQTWMTAFATVTFNLGDFSIDIGGRYTDLDKTSYIEGAAAEWIFDVRPCESRGADPANPENPDPETCTLHRNAINNSDPAWPGETFVLPGAGDVLWILPWRAERNTPLSWLGGRAAAVGLTTLRDLEGDGPYGPDNGGDFGDTATNPQLTLRWRPHEDHSLFFRYAESFKAGGFDTGVTSIPGSVEDYRFEGETGYTYELGSKGNLFDGMARYDVTIFETTFDDLQVSAATGNVDDPFKNINAGQQQVTGIEWNITMAPSDRMTVVFAGALMDGEMTDFPNAPCNLFESRTAETGPCLTEEEADAINDAAGEIVVQPDTIDRTGSPAPKTPDWKFVLGLDYEMPVGNDMVLSFNGQGYASDGFITDANGFSQIIKMNEHEDLNLTLSYGPMDGDWEVSLYGRNLLEARVEYNAEFDVLPEGHAATQLSRSDFKQYGVKFRYSF
jgi:outer membrane receptor protein involved in Fe transport